MFSQERMFPNGLNDIIAGVNEVKKTCLVPTNKATDLFVKCFSKCLQEVNADLYKPPLSDDHKKFLLDEIHEIVPDLVNDVFRVDNETTYARDDTRLFFEVLVIAIILHNKGASEIRIEPEAKNRGRGYRIP